ncbi:hypothetical protein F4824DRAFT_491169 [Ustulina deusta]|nr:hypothetical protein F4824DRAFT_491169 [Ustulina deusta]
MLELHFMVKTSMDEFKPEDRKLIRSHVMKGKNLGRMRALGSRRHLNSADTRESPATSSSSRDASSCDGSNGNASLPGISSGSPQHHECRTCIQATASIPLGIGSVASTMRLADSAKPEMVEVVIQFSSIAKKLLFQMEKCIFFDRRVENWVAPIAVDSAFLHASIFTSLSHFDAILPHSLSCENQRMIYHYHKTVSLLRKRLLFDNDEIRLSNNTVSVVLRLADQAFRAGDLKSALNHIQGIRRIINLRGGLSTFRGSEKLATEILRCDLGIVVYSGSNPILLQNAAFWDTYRMYPKLGVFLGKKDSQHSSTVHPFITMSAATHDVAINCQLVSAWSTMSDFCNVINLAADSEQLVTMETFLHSMVSVMYNLLDMHFEASSLDETIRLGLLSFACSVFLPWSTFGMPYPHLNSILRSHFTGLMANIPCPELIVWLLMACAITIFNESDGAWLRGLLREAASLYGINCWSQMRKILMSLMWIGIVHDKQGKRVFDAAIGCSNT